MQDESSADAHNELVPDSDSVHGASMVDLDAPLVLYNDRSNAITNLNRRLKFVIPAVLVYALLLCASQGLLTGIICFASFSITMAIGYLMVVRRFNRATKPLLQMDETGLTIRALLTDCHLDWNNVEEARAYRFIYKFAGINPRSISAIKGPLPVKLFLYMNYLSAMLYRLVGIKVCVINVPEQYAHLKAEEICEQIELRRQHHLALPDKSKPH